MPQPNEPLPFPTRTRDRRRSQRIDVLGQLQVHILSRPMPVAMREIGAGGFSIDTTAPIATGEQHRFEFHLDPSDRPVVVDAVSVHGARAPEPSSLAIYVTGFQFASLDADTRRAVDALVARIDELASL